MCKRGELSLVSAAVFEVGENEIPAISTVLAPIRHDVTGIPPAIFAWVGDEKTASTTVDADDFLLGLDLWIHGRSLPDVPGGPLFGSLR